MNLLRTRRRLWKVCGMYSHHLLRHLHPIPILFEYALDVEDECLLEDAGGPTRLQAGIPIVSQLVDGTTIE